MTDKNARKARDDRIRALLATILELWPIPPPPIAPAQDYLELIQQFDRENLELLNRIELLDSDPPPELATRRSRSRPKPKPKRD
jgi:hypothetical protein